MPRKPSKFNTLMGSDVSWPRQAASWRLVKLSEDKLLGSMANLFHKLCEPCNDGHCLLASFKMVSRKLENSLHTIKARETFCKECRTVSPELRTSHSIPNIFSQTSRGSPVFEARGVGFAIGGLDLPQDSMRNRVEISFNVLQFVFKASCTTSEAFVRVSVSFFGLSFAMI